MDGSTLSDMESLVLVLTNCTFIIRILFCRCSISVNRSVQYSNGNVVMYNLNSFMQHRIARLRQQISKNCIFLLTVYIAYVYTSNTCLYYMYVNIAWAMLRIIGKILRLLQVRVYSQKLCLSLAFHSAVHADT